MSSSEYELHEGMMREMLRSRMFGIGLALIFMLGATHAVEAKRSRPSIGDSSFGAWLHKSRFAARYIYTKNEKGNEVLNDLEYQAILGFTVRMADDKFRISTNARTGRSYRISWPATGVGTNDGAFEFHVRRLYLSADPADDFTVSFGSMGIERGESSEVTWLDNDGWISGARLRYDGDFLFSVTGGVLDEFNTPSVFERENHPYEIKEFNYANVVYGRELGDHDFSLGYGYFETRDYVRPAIDLNVRSWGIWADTIQVEDAYQFANGSSNSFSLKVARRYQLDSNALKISFYYNHQTKTFILPNADRISSGHSARATFFLTEFLQFDDLATVNLFAHHIHNITDSKKYRSELGFRLKF